MFKHKKVTMFTKTMKPEKFYNKLQEENKALYDCILFVRDHMDIAYLDVCDDVIRQTLAKVKGNEND